MKLNCISITQTLTVSAYLESFGRGFLGRRGGGSAGRDLGRDALKDFLQLRSISRRVRPTQSHVQTREKMLEASPDYQTVL